jgi:hypothetical protein
MKKRPKLTVIEGGKKDPAPFPFELFFPFAWWLWWLK